MSENASLDFSRVAPSRSSTKGKFTPSILEKSFSRPGLAGILIILALTVMATLTLGWIVGLVCGFVALAGKATYDTISTIARQNIDLDFDLNLVDSPVSSYRHQAESQALENEIWSQLNHKDCDSLDSQD